VVADCTEDSQGRRTTCLRVGAHPARGAASRRHRLRTASRQIPRRLPSSARRLRRRQPRDGGLEQHQPTSLASGFDRLIRTISAFDDAGARRTARALEQDELPVVLAAPSLKRRLARRLGSPRAVLGRRHVAHHFRAATDRAFRLHARVREYKAAQRSASRAACSSTVCVAFSCLSGEKPYFRRIRFTARAAAPAPAARHAAQRLLNPFRGVCAANGLRAALSSSARVRARLAERLADEPGGPRRGD